MINLSKREQSFYINTTKMDMFLILKQFSQFLKSDVQDWVDKAKKELDIIKNNRIE